MRAVVYKRYGKPEVLELTQIDKPVPKDNELLIKIYATTVTAADWRMRKAKPFVARFFSGLFKPTRVKILGFELAGVIEDVGAHIQKFKKGDEVFASCGFKFGAYAEYNCLRETNLVAIKPANVSFEEAAAVPIGGLTALRLLKMAGIRAGHQVLVYGASGSVGTYAVQLAKHYGAQVTAVCSGGNVAMVKGIGADNVVDYMTEDFTKSKMQFDIIVDAVGKTSKKVCKRILSKEGKYVTVSGNPKTYPDDMLVLKGLLEAGKLKPVIDRRYGLEEIREAHAYVEQFHKKGNVVVNVYIP